MNPTFQHMPVKSTTKRCTTYVPFAIKYLLPSYKQNIFHTSEILKDFFSYNYVKNVLYLKIKSVIRLTGTRMKNPVDNREASVSGRCFWSQKGPDLGDLGLFITVSESYFFCALGTVSFLIPISGNMYKSSSSKSHILPKFLRKSRCTLVTCGGEVSITKVRCL